MHLLFRRLADLFAYLFGWNLRDPKAPRVGPFPKIRAYFRKHYMPVDLRTAGVFRVVLGVLLIADNLRHSLEARLLYSNSGVLGNDYHLWQRTNGYEFSWFHAFSTLGEVKVCFALGLLCHFFVLIGWRSRLFAFLSFVFVTSMDSRIPFVENGGYVVVNLAALWAVFLPIERRFSVDAWLKSWRARRETSISELNDRSDFAGERESFVSIIGMLVVINLGAIYFWNVVNKAGDTWREGLTIHYVLYLNRMVTGLAVFFREILPEWPMRIIDWATLCVEAIICVCIFSPKAKRYTRLIAMGLMTMLHATFGTMMRLGPFSWFLIGSSTLLLTRVQFQDLRRWYEKRAPRWDVGLDARSPLGLAVGRVLMRLDNYERMTFVPLEEGSPALVAIREGEGNWIDSPVEVASGLARALPLGRYVYSVVNAVTLGAPARLLAFAAKRRDGISRYFGVGRPGPTLTPPSPVRSFFRAERWFFRELLLAWLGVAWLFQTYMENKGIPDEIKFDEWKLAENHFALRARLATINYFRIFQGWGMFAPNPITEDGVLVIDAYTIDGRRIDPYNGGQPMLDITHARGLAISQLRQDYGNRIRLDGNEHYRSGMIEWLSHYPEVTGNPKDEIVAFDVYWVRAKCPAPGSHEMYDNDAVPIFTWRKPGYRRPPELPPIPPQPKTRSAEKWEQPAPAPRAAQR